MFLQNFVEFSTEFHKMWQIHRVQVAIDNNTYCM